VLVDEDTGQSGSEGSNGQRRELRIGRNSQRLSRRDGGHEEPHHSRQHGNKRNGRHGRWWRWRHQSHRGGGGCRRLDKRSTRSRCSDGRAGLIEGAGKIADEARRGSHHGEHDGEWQRKKCSHGTQERVATDTMKTSMKMHLRCSHCIDQLI
jgi:hypothetical protein